MTTRYKKPSSNKHGITDMRVLKMLSAQKCKGKKKCIICGKVVYDSMMEAHDAAISYNIAFIRTGPSKKVPYECHESPGSFHFGAAVSSPAIAIQEARQLKFIPPPLPIVPEVVHVPVHVPVQNFCKIVEQPSKDMDEINLNGIIYIKKHLIPKSPAIIGSIFLNGVSYKIIK